eukprot:145920-Pelagomonas_calceolata.AAC.1
MFLPASSKLMTTNPVSKLLTAYPRLCHKFETISKDTYDNSRSWPSQKITLPQHTWDLQIMPEAPKPGCESMIVFDSMPGGNKLVGVHNRMGMKLASKSNGMFIVKSKLFELIKGVFNITGPANTQKDSMKSH